jgi:FdhD protein
MTRRTAPAPVRRVGPDGARSDQDLVAVEAPLEVVVTTVSRTLTRPLGVLMRTPGDDEELILGLLHAEGIVRTSADVTSVRFDPAGERADPDEAEADRIEVVLSDEIDMTGLFARTAAGTSACGMCGRLSLQALDAGRALTPGRPRLSATVLAALPDRLREGQDIFSSTGGLHAAALFDLAGARLAVREDVGRHNAVDKVIGAALAGGRLGSPSLILGVSGRVAYEIVQKAVMAGVCAVVAVGAPSSLAVEAARRTHLTLVGFARDGRFNVYAGANRL